MNETREKSAVGRISAESKKMASGAMLSALCLVLMLLGSVLELGIYAAPVLAGMLIVPYGEKYGRKYQLIVYAIISILSVLFVPGIEQNLMFVCFFGWYPMVREKLQKYPKLLRAVLKFLAFNAVVIGIEALIMFGFAKELMGSTLVWVLILLGNITFAVYDFAITRIEKVFGRLKKII